MVQAVTAYKLDETGRGIESPRWRWPRSAGRYAWGALLPLGLLGSWAVAVARAWAPPQILPPPELVLSTIVDLVRSGELLNNYLISLGRVAGGFLLGGVLGALLGGAMGLSKRVEHYLFPTFNALSQVPVLGWGMRLFGHMPVDQRDARRSLPGIRKAQRRVRERWSVLFFSEGTRTRDGTVGRFKSSAFRVAQRAEVRIVPVSIHAKCNYAQFRYQDGDCLLFGSESKGLPGSIRERFADTAVTIPMIASHVRSLNLATAVGIVLYEALRQRHGW